MFYDVNANNVLNMYNKIDINIIQPMDPMTGDHFTSTDEACNWGKGYLKTLYSNLMEMDMKMSFMSTAKQEITELHTQEYFYIVLTASRKITETKQIVIYNKATNEIDQTLTFKFVDGIAKAKVSFNDPGEFLLNANAIFKDNENEIFFIFKKEKDFTFSVIKEEE